MHDEDEEDEWMHDEVEQDEWMHDEDEEDEWMHDVDEEGTDACILASEREMHGWVWMSLEGEFNG